MRVLVACEYSAVVRDAFRARSHDAWSCDLLDTEGDPKWHIKGDITEVAAYPKCWDLMIAHPPCTHLAVSGARWWKDKQDEQTAAIDFVGWLASCYWIPRICIENPVGKLSTAWRKPDQIVQPWQFGDEATKTTCLWLKGLPKLEPDRIVGKGSRDVLKSGKSLPSWYNLPPGPNRWKARSRTFPGIARAMAEQWGSL